MNRESKNQLARKLFTETDLTRKEIAIQVGCTEKTLRSWIDKYDWEELREARKVTRGELLKDSYNQLKAVNKVINDKHGGVPTKELYDAKSILRKEIESLSNMPLHNYIEVFTEFNQWLQKTNPSKLLELLNLMDEFINEIAKEKGV